VTILAKTWLEACTSLSSPYSKKQQSRLHSYHLFAQFKNLCCSVVPMVCVTCNCLRCRKCKQDHCIFFHLHNPYAQVTTRICEQVGICWDSHKYYALLILCTFSLPHNTQDYNDHQCGSHYTHNSTHSNDKHCRIAIIITRSYKKWNKAYIHTYVHTSVMHKKHACTLPCVAMIINSFINCTLAKVGDTLLLPKYIIGPST